MEAMRRRVTKRGAAGHLGSAQSFRRDNGGRIPHSVISLPNASSDRAYSDACKKAGITPHPARMPKGLAEFYIRFLTDQFDHVHDSFLGSGTTALAAEKLKRYWSGCDKGLEYLRGSVERFRINGIVPAMI